MDRKISGRVRSTGGRTVKKEDMDKLNELESKFRQDPEYEAYTKLAHDAWAEYRDQKDEKSLMGSVDGNDYYLIYPRKAINLRGGKWLYDDRGPDMEIHKADGYITLYCEALCNRDVKFFVDKMLEDREKADPRIPISWLNEQAENPLRTDKFRNACDMVAMAWREAQEAGE